MTATQVSELTPLQELSARIGNDPLLTQGSTGNASIKLDGSLWIKASGKWMADAAREEILVPLDLEAVRQCVSASVDPTEHYTSASIETAMHAVFPHRVVLHVHCVDTIAWAVLRDAPAQLEGRLRGLRWQWIPHVSSGLALARAIEKAMRVDAGTQVLILGNHGLVLGGPDCRAVDGLLEEVRRRLSVTPRRAHPADYAALWEASEALEWDIAEDDDVHALGTDPVARGILAGGLLYPCQAIFAASSNPAALFRAVPFSGYGNGFTGSYRNRPFLILEDRGVIFNMTTTPAARAMLGGLAQVVQRIGPNVPLRYLTDDETPDIYGVLASRYRELSSAGRAHS